MSTLAELVSSLLAFGLALGLALPGPEPAPVRVPAELLARTSMPELSGIAWSPSLSRYLVISDDTGDKQQGTNHAPWLFTMSRDGVLDGAPLPIAGLDKLNDAEGLCAGPDGTYLLATSHSASRKGHDKAERRRLFQLQLSGRELRILGSLDLATAIAESGLLPQGPGLTPGGVDIEALAFRAGELYVGLKAPQTAAGAALILRVRDVLPALQSGRLAADKVQRFAEVPLRVAGADGTVVQGISDMTFLPDGSLALLANSPKNMPADGGGALWWLRPGGSPTLLRRFQGLKPEGVTLTPDGKELVIVFDHDRENPLWLRQPLPAEPAGAPAAPKQQPGARPARPRPAR